MTYIGQVLSPFKDFTSVLEFECREIGATGLRETIRTQADLIYIEMENKRQKGSGLYLIPMLSFQS